MFNETFLKIVDDPPQCFTKLLQKPFGSNVKTSFPAEKAFSTVLCSFNVRMPLLQHLIYPFFVFYYALKGTNKK